MTTLPLPQKHPLSPMVSSSKISSLGRHLLVEFYHCDSEILKNAAVIEDAMCEAAVRCGATIVQQNFHEFSPYGVSGVVIIAESHLAIHTWPEHRYAAVDLFTCGNSCQPEIAYQYLQERLKAGSAFYSELCRGLLNHETREMVQAPFQVAFEKEGGHHSLAEAPPFTEKPMACPV